MVAVGVAMKLELTEACTEFFSHSSLPLSGRLLLNQDQYGLPTARRRNVVTEQLVCSDCSSLYLQISLDRYCVAAFEIGVTLVCDDQMNSFNPFEGLKPTFVMGNDDASGGSSRLTLLCRRGREVGYVHTYQLNMEFSASVFGSGRIKRIQLNLMQIQFELNDEGADLLLLQLVRQNSS
ncbi:unnamed protein product [Ilex paraguariensis]|uniref:Uncharacterized protein n=1 Tax=Ilex paraguariensis TaxID=185542 RepID=A0ABC8TXW0_9AQUA